MFDSIRADIGGESTQADLLAADSVRTLFSPEPVMPTPIKDQRLRIRKRRHVPTDPDDSDGDGHEELGRLDDGDDAQSHDDSTTAQAPPGTQDQQDDGVGPGASPSVPPLETLGSVPPRPRPAGPSPTTDQATRSGGGTAKSTRQPDLQPGQRKVSKPKMRTGVPQQHAAGDSLTRLGSVARQEDPATCSGGSTAVGTPAELADSKTQVKGKYAGEGHLRGRAGVVDPPERAIRKASLGSLSPVSAATLASANSDCTATPNHSGSPLGPRPQRDVDLAKRETGLDTTVSNHVQKIAAPPRLARIGTEGPVRRAPRRALSLDAGSAARLLESEHDAALALNAYVSQVQLEASREGPLREAAIRNLLKQEELESQSGAVRPLRHEKIGQGAQLAGDDQQFIQHAKDHDLPVQFIMAKICST